MSEDDPDLSWDDVDGVSGERSGTADEDGCLRLWLVFVDERDGEADVIECRPSGVFTDRLTAPPPPLLPVIFLVDLLPPSTVTCCCMSLRDFKFEEL